MQKKQSIFWLDYIITPTENYTYLDINMDGIVDKVEKWNKEKTFFIIDFQTEINQDEHEIWQERYKIHLDKILKMK